MTAVWLGGKSDSAGMANATGTITVSPEIAVLHIALHQAIDMNQAMALQGAECSESRDVESEDSGAYPCSYMARAQCVELNVDTAGSAQASCTQLLARHASACAKAGNAHCTPLVA